MSHRRVFSGSPLEGPFGYCRALRAGDRILVAGTAPVWPDGSCPEDAGEQARRCLDIIAGALQELGAGMGDVVRTRMYVTDAAYSQDVGSAHGEAFAGHPPVSSMVVVAGLLDPRWRVEIEAEADLGE
jgi:enamine deaminase RidA (YjgF/YER057c/UK114 family)